MAKKDSEAIMERVQAQAKIGATTELDSVPKNLWDLVCESNREVQLSRWRAGGWHVDSVECDKGCCRYDRFTPPSVDPERVQTCKCTRGVKYKVLASFNDQNRAGDTRSSCPAYFL